MVWRRPVISFFIVFQLGLITCWLFCGFLAPKHNADLPNPVKFLDPQDADDHPNPLRSAANALGTFGQGATETFKPYVLMLGLEQDFGMFAPAPRTHNLHIVALITYEDGTTKLWFYPSPDRFNMLDRMGKERYRKFMNDNVASSTYVHYWRDIARFVGRLNNIYPGNKPVMVAFFRYKSEIPPPPQALGKTLPADTEMTQMMTYTLTPKDLEP